MTKEEILKTKNITSDTKYHNYNYLYNSILEAMQAYADQQTAELRDEVERLKNNNQNNDIPESIFIGY